MTALPAMLHAWAIFGPDGKPQCLHNGYSVYRTKREALLDCDTDCTVKRIELRYTKGKP